MPSALVGGRRQVGYDARTGHEVECPYLACSDGWNGGAGYVHVRDRDRVHAHGTGSHRSIHVHGSGCGHCGSSFVDTWVVRRIHHHASRSHPSVPVLGLVSSSPWMEGNHGHHSSSNDHLRGP